MKISACIEKEKRTYQQVDSSVPVNQRVKNKESEKIHKYLDLAREQKITVKHEGDRDTDCHLCSQNGPHRIYQTITKISCLLIFAR